MKTLSSNDKKLIRNFCKRVVHHLKEPRPVKHEVEEELFSNIKNLALSYVDEKATPHKAVKMALNKYESPQSVLKN